MTAKTVRSSERILLFDSVPLTESVLTSELNSLGFRVDTANDANQAWRLANERPHDLLLISDAVPRDVAVDLCTRVRDHGADAPPILLLTPLGAIESQADRSAFRADDFLVTPYSETEILIRVRALLDARAQVEELRSKVHALTGGTGSQDVRLGTDDLTELPNRQYLEDFATRELIRAERYDRAISLVKVAIDNLQSVSAEYGDAAGDEMLRQVAAMFKRSVRCVDFTARYDDAGFAIVLPETDKQGAALAAERVRQRIECLQLQNSHSNTIPRVIASLGVATFPDDAPDLSELIGIADLRVCVARKQGSNRVAIAES